MSCIKNFSPLRGKRVWAGEEQGTWKRSDPLPPSTDMFFSHVDPFSDHFTTRILFTARCSFTEYTWGRHAWSFWTERARRWRPASLAGTGPGRRLCRHTGQSQESEGGRGGGGKRPLAPAMPLSPAPTPLPLALAPG